MITQMTRADFEAELRESREESQEHGSKCSLAIQTLVAMVQNLPGAHKDLHNFCPETRDALIEAAGILRQDINLAIVLQKGLLPKMPASKQWDLSFFYRPMVDVSGDILDAYTFGDVFFDEADADEQLGLLLLDASGHGIASALVAAIARPIFFGYHRLNKDRPLYHAMQDANVEICREIGTLTNYLTGISVRLGRDSLTYVNAAHPPALLFRTRTGRVRELPNSGVILGVPMLMGQPFVSHKAPIESGDILFLYTDGLTEATNAEGKMLDVEPLAKCLIANAHRSAAEIHQEIQDITESFTQGYKTSRDDITFVVAKRN